MRLGKATLSRSPFAPAESTLKIVGRPRLEVIEPYAEDCRRVTGVQPDRRSSEFAQTALLLKSQGIARVRPLLGGAEAWEKRAGPPLS